MHINELRGRGEEEEEEEGCRQIHTEAKKGVGGGKGKKYVEMTKADAMQEASGEDETLKTARLPSGEREGERERAAFLSPEDQ